MNTKNRLLSLVLALVMVFGAFAPAVSHANIATVDKTFPKEVKAVRFNVKNQDGFEVDYKYSDDLKIGDIDVYYRESATKLPVRITKDVELGRAKDKETGKLVRDYILTRKGDKAFDHGLYQIVLKESNEGVYFSIGRNGVDKDELWIDIVEGRGNIKINAIGDEGRVGGKSFIIAKATMENGKYVLNEGFPHVGKDALRINLPATNINGSTFANFKQVGDKVVVTAARDGRSVMSDRGWEIYKLRGLLEQIKTLDAVNYTDNTWKVLDQKLQEAVDALGAKDRVVKEKDLAKHVLNASKIVLLLNSDKVETLSSLPTEAALAKANKELALALEGLDARAVSVEVREELIEEATKLANELDLGALSTKDYSNAALQVLKDLAKELHGGQAYPNENALKAFVMNLKEAKAQEYLQKIEEARADWTERGKLGQAIEEAKAVKRSHYNEVADTVWTALEAAISTAEGVYNVDDKVQEDYKKEIAPLTVAKEAVVDAGLSDLGRLAAAVEKLDGVKKEDVDGDWGQYNTALNEAKALLEKEYTDVQDLSTKRGAVDTKTTGLANAEKALVDAKKEVAKINILNGGLDNIKSDKTDENEAKAEVIAAIKKAATDANVDVADWATVDQAADIDGAKAAAKAIYNDLVTGEDVSGKETAVETAKSELDTAKENLATALKDVNDAAKAAQKKLEDAHKALTVKVAPAGPLTVSMLEGNYKAAQDLHKQYENKVTAASLAKLNKAIDLAKKTLDNPNSVKRYNALRGDYLTVETSKDAAKVTAAQARIDASLAKHEDLLGANKALLEAMKVFFKEAINISQESLEIAIGEVLVVAALDKDGNVDPKNTQFLNVFTYDVRNKTYSLKDKVEMDFFFMGETNITLRVRIETVDKKPVPNAEVAIGLAKDYAQGALVEMGEVLRKEKTNAEGYFEISLPRFRVVELIGHVGNAYYRDAVNYELNLPYLVQQLDNGGNEGVVKSDKIYNLHNNLYVGDNIYELHIINEVDQAKDRISGANRYGTAVEVAKKNFPAGLKEFDNHTNLVISSGENYPDSLTASTTAFNFDAPLVLVQKDAIPEETLNYIKANLVGKTKPRVIIVGGPATISEKVEKEITDLGIKVERIYGSDRYATSVVNAKRLVNLAEKHKTLMKGLFTEKKAVLASGENFPDALAVASPAARVGLPLLLTRANDLPADVKEFIKDYKLAKMDVIGGEASVSETVKNQLVRDHKLVVERVSGTNRTMTSLVIAGRYFPNANHVFVTSGAVFADALTGGAYAAREGSPVILLPNATTVSDQIKEYIKDSRITNFTILGGTNTVSVEARNEVSELILNR